MAIQPLYSLYNGQTQGSTPPLRFNLQPGTTITIRVDQTGSAQAAVSPNAGSTPEDRVTIGTEELPPSRYDDLNAKYSAQYPGASSSKQNAALEPSRAQASNKTPQAKNSQPQRLQSPQSTAQPASWLPPSSYSDLDRTLERYYINKPAPVPGGNQAGPQSGTQDIASDIANISSAGETT
jgi:hypothetical protein